MCITAGGLRGLVFIGKISSWSDQFWVPVCEVTDICAWVICVSWQISLFFLNRNQQRNVQVLTPTFLRAPWKDDRSVAKANTLFFSYWSHINKKGFVRFTLNMNFLMESNVKRRSNPRLFKHIKSGRYTITACIMPFLERKKLFYIACSVLDTTAYISLLWPNWVL